METISLTKEQHCSGLFVTHTWSSPAQDQEVTLMTPRELTWLISVSQPEQKEPGTHSFIIHEWRQ